MTMKQRPKIMHVANMLIWYGFGIPFWVYPSQLLKGSDRAFRDGDVSCACICLGFHFYVGVTVWLKLSLRCQQVGVGG